MAAARTMTAGNRAEQSLSCKLADHMASPFFQAEVSEMIRLAGRAPDSLWLDIGCGNGGFIAEARSDSVRVLGMDLSRETLEAARELSTSDAFLQAAAQKVPIRPESVDAIFAQHVIEHLSDPATACREWNRVLREGGRLIVVTPNARYPNSSIYEDPSHVRIYGSSTLRTLLETTGYKVDRIETIFPYLAGHTVLGLRHRRLFSIIPPWSRSGRSLVALARKTGRAHPSVG